MDIRKIVSLSLVAVLLTNIAACGTILHPERRGQAGGRIDPAIAILDGIGLLFFVIPGVIAFAVDFSNGSIYLPGGRRNLSSGDDQPNPLKVVSAPKNMDAETLEKIIALQTSIKVDLTDPNITVLRSDSLQDVENKIALFSKKNMETASTAH